MKFNHYLKRVEESEEYKKFKEKHKNAFLSAGFFVLDFEQGKDMHQIDFFIPGKKKVATFKLESGINVQISDTFNGKKPEEMDTEANIDLEALKGIVHDEMMNRTITQEIKKIIAVLQKNEDRKVWKLNCITQDLSIIKVKVDDKDSSVLEFEKANLFDFVKRLPGKKQDNVPQPKADNNL